jgi:hypothetical protein
MQRTISVALLAILAGPGCDRPIVPLGPFDGPPSQAAPDGPPTDAPAAPRADGPLRPDASARDAAPRDASTADAAPDGPGKTYTSPADFDRTGCQATGFDALALDGTWFLELIGDGAMFSSPPGVRFSHAMGRLEGTINLFFEEQPLEHLEQTATELFFYQSLDFGGPPGSGNRMAFLACTVADPAGDLFEGLAATCFENMCVVGRFRAHRVKRLAGEGESAGVTKLGEFGAFGGGPAITANVRVQGNLAYMARYGDGLRILDVTDPAQIRLLGHGPIVAPGEIYNDVRVSGSIAFLASSAHGVVPWDVSDPNAPVRLPAVLDNYDVHTIFLEGTTLYAAATDGASSGLGIIDVSNPRMPRLVGLPFQPELTSYLHDLYVEPGRAYLDYWDAGLVIVDVRDPMRPRELGRYAGYTPATTNHSNWVTTIGGRKICVTGDESFGAHARILDVTDPAAILPLAEWETRPAVSIHNILAEGDRAFISYYQDGLRVLDLSNPAAPRQIAYFNSWDPATGGTGFFSGAIGIDKIGNRLYLADMARGLIILQLDI